MGSSSGSISVFAVTLLGKPARNLFLAMVSFSMTYSAVPLVLKIFSLRNTYISVPDKGQIVGIHHDVAAVTVCVFTCLISHVSKANPMPTCSQGTSSTSATGKQKPNALNAKSRDAPAHI